MRKISFAFVFTAMVAGLWSNGAAQSNTVVVHVDPGVRYQRWDGFGTSLCWWANIVGGYPDSVRNSVMEMVFGGLGLNVVRYNIGGGENPMHHHMEVRANMPGFEPSPGVWDWTADANQRWVLQQCARMGVNKFEAFSNSPPYWMTLSGCSAGASGGGNNLNPAYVNSFANYLATVVQHYKTDFGITFDTLEPLNEPDGSWWTYGGRQEGCHVDPGADQAAVIEATGKALQNLGLTTTVSASDENTNDQAVASWDALPIQVKDYVTRVNTHSYGGNSQHNLFQRATRDTKKLWVSEYGDGDATGLTMAHQIVTDLQTAMPTAWVYWQAVEQAPSGWGMLTMDLNGGGQTFGVNEKYYVMQAFSKTIRPGDQFIAQSDPNTVAVLSPTQLKIITVADQAETLVYDLSRFRSLVNSAGVHQTTSIEHFAGLPRVPIVNKTITLQVPAGSVTCITVLGYTYKGTLLSGFYNLQSARTGNVLTDPSGSWNLGTLMTTEPFTGAYDQEWTPQGTGDGHVKFFNRDSGLYFGIDNGNPQFPVLQWSDNGDTTIQWDIFPVIAGSYRLQNVKRDGYGATDVLDENPFKGNGWPDVSAYNWYGGTEEEWHFNLVAPLFPPN